MYISVTYFYDKCHGFKCHIYVSVFFFLGWGHWVEFFLIIFLDWGFSHSYWGGGVFITLLFIGGRILTDFITESEYFCRFSCSNNSIMRWSVPLNSTAWKHVHWPPWFDLMFILQNWDFDVKPVNFWGTPARKIRLGWNSLGYYVLETLNIIYKSSNGTFIKSMIWHVERVFNWRSIWLIKHTKYLWKTTHTNIQDLKIKNWQDSV